MTEPDRNRLSLGLLLLALSFLPMLGELVGPQAEPPLPEIGKAFYLAGLLLAVSGNVLTMRGLGPGPWHSFLRGAIILDSLACVSPLLQLALYFLPPLKDALENIFWNWLVSVPLHLAAIAVLLWALGEVCFVHRIPFRRPRLIQFGIFCLFTAICFFVTAEEGQVNTLFVVACLLGQMALVFPILKIRVVLTVIDAPK